MPQAVPVDWYLHISTGHWWLLVVAAMIIGISKTGFPGVGILAIPLAAFVIPARESTGVVLPMLLLADMIAVAYYRRHAEVKYLVKLLPCAVAGVLVGYFLLGKVTDRQLKPLIGGVILALLLVTWWRMWMKARSGEPHVPPAWWFPVVMGLMAGVVTMMANAAGPILGFYLLAMRLPKDGFIGTGAWFTLTLNAFKMPFSASLGLLTTHSLFLNLQLSPFIIVGALLGLWLVRYVPEKGFTLLVHVLTAAAAVQLLSTVLGAGPVDKGAGSQPATAPAASTRAPGTRNDPAQGRAR